MNIVHAADGTVPQSLSDLTTSFNNYVIWFGRIFWVVIIVYFIWVAVTFLRANGDPSEVEASKKMLLYGVIAACIALLATGIKSIAGSLLSGPTV
jgi:hypothetical protein